MDNADKKPVQLEVLHFETTIDAGAEKVYETMLDKNHYAEWTAPFSPNSRFSGSWEKGTEIRFFGTDPDGNSGGMISRVRENIPNKFVSLEPVGIIKEGEEITSGPEIEEWAGTLENYTFSDSDGKTLLQVDMHIDPKWRGFMLETWPESLDILKKICER